MSRGAGRIQRILIEVTPSAVFSACELIELAFPHVEHEAKHRVAALRAARSLAETSPQFDVYQGTPRAGGMILCNATDRRSLGVAKVFQKIAGTRSVAECVAFIDDPTSAAYPEAHVGGFFDLLARRNAAWADDRDVEAETLTIQIRGRVAQAERVRSASSSMSPQETKP